MIYTVDRIEDSIAILEEESTQKMKQVPLAILPGEIREGDCYIYIDGEYRICPGDTDKRRKAIENLMDGLWK